MNHDQMIDELFIAVQAGDVTRLKDILTIDKNFANMENEDGLTPLGYAAHIGQAGATKLLIDFGAEINALSHSKISFIPSNTALHAAIAGKRNIEVIETLLMHKADINIVDSNGHTALMTAAFHADNVEIIRLLIDNGADVHMKTDKGDTAFSIAVEQGNKNVAECLNRVKAR